MERKWIIAISTAGLVMSTLIVALLIHASFHRDICDRDICDSQICVKAATQIIKYIDQDVKPCDNFYNFVCGNFIKTMQIPDDSYEISTFSILNHNLQRQLKNILEQPIEIEEIAPFRILKKYYKSCTDTDEIEKLGLKEIDELLKSVGGWPVLEKGVWDQKNLEWFHYIYKFREHGLITNQLLKIDVEYDFKNTSHRMLQIDRPKFTLPREFLSDENQNEYVEEYRRYMVNVAIYLGADEYKATSEMQECLHFEIELANLTFTQENRSTIEDYYNVMTIRELESEHPTIPWLEYINNLLVPHAQITTHERILAFYPNYINQLEKLLQKTSERIIINYLVWKVVESLVPFLNEDLRDIEFKFKAVTTGVVQKKERWKECVDEISMRLPIAISAKYVHQYFDDNTKVEIDTILWSIKQHYGGSMEQFDWLDKATKKAAVEKIEEMTDIIGYPEELLEIKNLEEIYQEVDINWDQYFQSHLIISKSNENFKYKSLRLLKSKIGWLSHSNVAVVDAFYRPLMNTLTIPAGILQHLYYDKARPFYMNFAGVGFAIAHEIGHGFDDIGRLFNKHGELINWWKEDAELSYFERVECLIKQYNDYNITQMNELVNGEKTLSDNIADNSGIRHSYGGYVDWEKKNPGDNKLPGLDYTARQLFWITYGVNLCSKQRTEFLEFNLPTEPHAFPEFRVNGPLSNNKDFINDFDCEDDTEMNSHSKCIVW